MTLGKKLYIGFGSALLITLLMGVAAIRNVSSLGADISGLANKSARNLYLSGRVNVETSDLLASMRGLLLDAHTDDLEDAHKHYLEAEHSFAEISKDGTKFLEISTRPELRDTMQSAILTKSQTLEESLSALYQLIQKRDIAGGDALYRDHINAQVQSISAVADDLNDKEMAQVSSRANIALDKVGPAYGLAIVMMVISLVLGAGIIYIVRGINIVLQSSVVELRDGADQVANAASQVSSSSQSLAQGASEQAASLEETSASSEEINSMARKNTDNSRSTAELLTQSQQRVSQANSFLEDMVISMSQITESSGKISKIIKVIDETAFQTNILALNAAVEAARAGEAGMGFAVVADEVRSLAQRSAQAAKDTAVLIEDSIAKSNEGKHKVDQVAQAIRTVTEDAARAKMMVDEVSMGSDEQAKGIDQIGRAISQMEQVTQTTAANAEQSAAAAEELSAQSEALKDVINRLQEMVGGSDGDVGYTQRKAPARNNAPMRATIPSSASTTARRSTSALVRPPSSDRGLAASARPVARGAGTTRDEFPMEDNFQSF